jgi:acetyl-CoA synthetase
VQIGFYQQWQLRQFHCAPVYWITGRVDDVLNISGHRLGTAEIESALVLYKDVSEAAVVGYPHDIKGQGIYAYVSLMNGVKPTDELKTALVDGNNNNPK